MERELAGGARLLEHLLQKRHRVGFNSGVHLRIWLKRLHPVRRHNSGSLVNVRNYQNPRRSDDIGVEKLLQPSIPSTSPFVGTQEMEVFLSDTKLGDAFAAAGLDFDVNLEDHRFFFS